MTDVGSAYIHFFVGRDWARPTNWRNEMFTLILRLVTKWFTIEIEYRF